MEKLQHGSACIASQMRALFRLRAAAFYLEGKNMFLFQTIIHRAIRHFMLAILSVAAFEASL